MGKNLKATPVDAIQFIGNNVKDIEAFTNGTCTDVTTKNELFVYTFNGDLCATVGEWIVKLNDGKLFPCGHYLFSVMYKRAIEIHKQQEETNRQMEEFRIHNMGVIVYVAGAYSGTPDEIKHNIAVAEKASINLIRSGFSVYTPHKNCAHYEIYEDDDITVDTWYEMGINILSKCDAIYVLKDSEESNGTTAEIDFAQSNFISVFREEDYPSDELTIEDFMKSKYMPMESVIKCH